MTLGFLKKAVTCALLTLAGSQHNFGLDGKALLCVPDSDMDPLLKSYANESIHLQIGSGHTPGFSFLFRLEIIKPIISRYLVVPGFDDHPYANAFAGTVGFLDPSDQARFGPGMRAREVQDEWYSQGKCPHSSVKVLPATNFYEAKCSINDDFIMIWSGPPDPNKPVPKLNELVVATCQLKYFKVGPYSGKKLSNCSRVVIIDGFLVDYKFQEDNAEVIPQLDAMIRDRIGLWKKNCSSPI
jgi:hypothetical protein